MKYLRIAVTLALAAVFIAAGAAKFMNVEAVVAQFGRFGLPGWFMMLTGAVEIAGAALILAPIPATQRAGGILLMLTMLAGAGFHFRSDPPLAAAPALALAALAGFIALTARRRPAPA